MKKKGLRTLLSLLLVMSLIPVTSVMALTSPSPWAAEAVTNADSLGLIPSELNVNYTENITRGEFCALAVTLYEKFMGISITQFRDFTDTEDVNVRKIGGINVVSGTGNGEFNPYGEITRQEAAVILANLMSALGEPLPTSESTFADTEQIDTWAIDAVGQVQAAGIMSGTGNNNFTPKGDEGKYTREQSIITLLRIWNLLEVINLDIDILEDFSENQQENTNSSVDFQSNSLEEESDSNILIAYFSMPERDGVDAVAGASRVVIDGEVLGNNQYVARLIQQSIGGDLFEIKTVQEYPSSHDALVEFGSSEKSQNARPELASQIEKIESYDIVFLGYPNWWADLPMPLYSFLEGNDFSGKTIIPFSVHGGSGFSNTIRTITNLQPNATVVTNGFTTSRNTLANAGTELTRWVQSLGLINE